jgi:hypothetical protein
MAMHMAEKNEQTGKEVDRVFKQHKTKEKELMQVIHSNYRFTFLFHPIYYSTIAGRSNRRHPQCHPKTHQRSRS